MSKVGGGIPPKHQRALGPPGRERVVAAPSSAAFGGSLEGRLGSDRAGRRFRLFDLGARSAERSSQSLPPGQCPEEEEDEEEATGRASFKRYGQAHGHYKGDQGVDAKREGDEERRRRQLQAAHDPEAPAEEDHGRRPSEDQKKEHVLEKEGLAEQVVHGDLVCGGDVVLGHHRA